jgi:hypothetical protein
MSTADRRPVGPADRSSRSRRRAARDGRRRRCSPTSRHAGIRSCTQRRFGKKYLPRRWVRLRVLRRDGDGWQDLLFVNSTPGRARGANRAASTATTRRHLPRHHARLGPRRRVTDRRRGPTSTTTARTLHHALGGNRLFRGSAAGSRGRDRSAAASAPRLFDERAVVRLTTATAARSLRRPLRALVDRDGSVLHARRQEKSYCTPESYRGHGPALFHNRGQRHFEDRHAPAGAVRHHVQGHSASRSSTSTPTAGWICRPQRQQPNRLYRNKGDGTVSRRGDGRRRRVSEAGVASAPAWASDARGGYD